MGDVSKGKPISGHTNLWAHESHLLSTSNTTSTLPAGCSRTTVADHHFPPSSISTRLPTTAPAASTMAPAASTTAPAASSTAPAAPAAPAASTTAPAGRVERGTATRGTASREGLEGFDDIEGDDIEVISSSSTLVEGHDGLAGDCERLRRILLWIPMLLEGSEGGFRRKVGKAEK